MAAALQKEINVSITEDATMSLTRSEGGAKVVRVDAIAIVPAQGRLSWVAGTEIIACTSLSLLPKQGGVNGRERVMENCALGARLRRLILAEELSSILDKTDEHDYGGARQANKKHDFQ